MAKSERVKQLKKHFMEYREKGYSIAEIAKEFQLSSITVYSYLEEIARDHGVTRESLLYMPHKPHQITKKSKTQKEEIDVEALQKDFSDAIETINAIISEIDKKLQEDIDNGTN